jgi:hypothetical protein
VKILRGKKYFEIVRYSDSHLSTSYAASISASFYKFMLTQAKIRTSFEVE